MRRAILVIGDKKINRCKPAPSYNSFIRHIKRLKRKGQEVHIADYKDVLTDRLPDLYGHFIKVILFFPFDYWNRNIEVYDIDSRIYGDKKFGQEYKKFFEKIERCIKRRYIDKKIEYVNPPASSILERDKKESKRLFQRYNIPTPESFVVKRAADIEKLISQGKSLYIKPRFGSMGKGITYLSKDVMITNFLLRKGKIVSRPYDYNWRFCKIRDIDRKRFLDIFISRGFICEEAVELPIHNGRKFDFRVYYIYGKCPYYYVRSMRADSPITNWSQGGRIEKKETFSRYVSGECIRQIKIMAKRVARALNLNYTGVDVMFSKDFKKIYVSEAHSFPGFEKGFDLMEYLAREILVDAIWRGYYN